MFLVSFFHQNTLKTSDLIDKSNATKASYIMNSIQATLLSIATLPLCQKKRRKDRGHDDEDKDDDYDDIGSC